MFDRFNTDVSTSLWNVAYDAAHGGVDRVVKAVERFLLRIEESPPSTRVEYADALAGRPGRGADRDLLPRRAEVVEVLGDPRAPRRELLVTSRIRRWVDGFLADPLDAISRAAGRLRVW